MGLWKKMCMCTYVYIINISILGEWDGKDGNVWSLIKKNE